MKFVFLFHFTAPRKAPVAVEMTVADVRSQLGVNRTETFPVVVSGLFVEGCGTAAAGGAAAAVEHTLMSVCVGRSVLRVPALSGTSPAAAAAAAAIGVCWSDTDRPTQHPGPITGENWKESLELDGG